MYLDVIFLEEQHSSPDYIGYACEADYVRTTVLRRASCLQSSRYVHFMGRMRTEMRYAVRWD